jgi:hypothetical protein
MPPTQFKKDIYKWFHTPKVSKIKLDSSAANITLIYSIKLLALTNSTYTLNEFKNKINNWNSD